MYRFTFLFLAAAALVAFSASDVAAQCHGGHGGHGGFAYYGGSPGVGISYSNGHGGGHYGGHHGGYYAPVYSNPAPIVYYGGGHGGYSHYPVYHSNYYPSCNRGYYGGYGQGHGGSGWSVGIRF